MQCFAEIIRFVRIALYGKQYAGVAVGKIGVFGRTYRKASQAASDVFSGEPERRAIGIGVCMEEIRNSQGKLVCRVDKMSKTVEIVLKGCTTLIRFASDGTITVTNKAA